MSRVASSLTTNADHSMYDARGYSIIQLFSWIHFIADGRRCLYFINSNFGVLCSTRRHIWYTLCLAQHCTLPTDVSTTGLHALMKLLATLKISTLTCLFFCPLLGASGGTLAVLTPHGIGTYYRGVTDKGHTSSPEIG